MVKFLILACLIYWGYWKLKKFFLPPSDRRNAPRNAAPLDDEILVKDPQCNTYLPKRLGVHLRIDDRDFYFCSKACRDKFLAGYANHQQEE